MKARNGQVALFLLLVMVVLVLLTLLNVDTFIAVRNKNRLQNAGDAAALAAARKQGSLVNELGRLNLAHFEAAVRNDARECADIVERQKRLALLGPVEALRLANEAALKNGMEVRDEFAAILRKHVQDIRTVYAGGNGQSGEPYPEPFPGAWTEYATAIDNVISEGLATGPDNVEFYDAAGGHLLLNRQFYHAIAGENWCWFHFNAEGVLKNYGSYHDWAPLPSRRENSLDNSEIFSLHVTAKRGALSETFTTEELLALSERYSERPVTEEELAKSYLITNKNQTWFFFDQAMWRTWFNGLHLADDEDSYDFPIVGEIKPEYNVRGCAAICRCVSSIDAIAVNLESDHTWSAAAKPFGTLESLEGEMGPVTLLKNFVVPCLTDVRLVPMDAVGGENLATADYGWVTHIREHLAPYLAHGPRDAQGCFYCLQLQTWEHDTFRKNGVRWLKYNSGNCIRPTGGPGGHGGTSHGH